MHIYVNYWSLPNNSITHAMHFQNNQKDTLCCITFCVHQSTVCQVRFLGSWRLWCSKAEHYLPELRKQINIHKIYVVMILKKLKWPFFDLTQLAKVHTKASSKIKRLGRSVSQRRMLRETEKLPLKMIDEKPTDGTSTSKKDQHGHGMMKSENFFKEFCTHNHRTQTANWRIFLVKMVMEWWMLIFFSLEFFSTEFFKGFRTYVVATTACTTGCGHTLTCRTHKFLLHSLSAHIRTSSCVCTHTHGSSAWKGSIAHVWFTCLPPAVPARSLRDRSRLRLHWRPLPLDLAVLSRPKSAGHAPLRTCIAKFGYLAESDANTGYEPKEFDKISAVDDGEDAHQLSEPQFSDFSKNTHENKGLFGVLTMFESSVSHGCHDDVDLWIESKEACNRETVARQREREEREGSMISVAESMSKKV